MAWLTPSDVSDVYPTIVPTQALLDHVQGLAESTIGTQTEPISNRVKAVTVDIVARVWSKQKAAETSPEGFQRERIDDYEYEQFPAAGVLGLGLTKAEKAALRLAAGLLPLQTVGTTRNEDGAVEMAEDQSATIDVTDPDLGSL